jgi:hypothetical protein
MRVVPGPGVEPVAGIAERLLDRIYRIYRIIGVCSTRASARTLGATSRGIEVTAIPHPRCRAEREAGMMSTAEIPIIL